MAKKPRKIYQSPSVRERGRAIIKETVESFDGPVNAGMVRARIITTKWKQILADPPLLELFAHRGLEAEIRDALKIWGLLGTGDEDAPELNLFPEHEREIVLKIAIARIWVPSKKQHQTYHDADADTLEESGNYYLLHGQGEINRGELLLQLADLRRNPPAEAAFG